MTVRASMLVHGTLGQSMKYGISFPQKDIGNDPIVIRDFVQAAEGGLEGAVHRGLRAGLDNDLEASGHQELKRPVAILLDLQGPKIRVGTMAEPLVLVRGRAREELRLRVEIVLLWYEATGLCVLPCCRV